jgi:hypothetical protein
MSAAELGVAVWRAAGERLRGNVAARTGADPDGRLIRCAAVL